MSGDPSVLLDESYARINENTKDVGSVQCLQLAEAQMAGEKRITERQLTSGSAGWKRQGHLVFRAIPNLVKEDLADAERLSDRLIE